MTLFVGIWFAKPTIKTANPLSIKNTICQSTGENCKTTYYKSSITYLGTENEGLSLGFSENFEKHAIFFNPIILEDKKTFSEEEFMNKINWALDTIRQSNTIIINTNNFDGIFQILGKMNTNSNIGLKGKTIYLVTDINKNFLKRTLAKYIKLVGVEKIYTLPQDELLNFMTALSFEKKITDQTYITNFSLTFQETPKLLLISYLIDNLISNGFPIDLIAIILLLSIGALVVSIFRQVIGFSSFGIYSPILFALSIAALGVPISLLLLLIWAVAKIITSFFCKKIYLLHNAKTTMLIILYFLFLITVVSLDSIFKTNLVDIDIFTTVFSLFPIVFIIIVTDKVFNEGFKIFNWGWVVSFVEFLIISFVVRWLLNRIWLKHLLLSYPEIIILILILNIFIGRFTGLQVLEYFRFMPMISRHLDGEEEE
jgi:hypothetical protein